MKESYLIKISSRRITSERLGVQYFVDPHFLVEDLISAKKVSCGLESAG